MKSNRMNVPQRGRRQVTYRRYRRFNRKKTTPVYSSKPIRMGMGSTTINVSTALTTSSVNLGTVLFGDVLNDSTEFAVNIAHYMYFRINFVKAVCLPSNVPNTGAEPTVGYLLVNWVNDNDITRDQLIKSDNTKIFPMYSTNVKYYTWYPPNISISGVNLKSFISTQSIPYLGTMHTYCPGNKYVRIEINVSFRGARDFQINALIDKLNYIKLKDVFKNNNKENSEVEKDNSRPNDL